MALYDIGKKVMRRVLSGAVVHRWEPLFRRALRWWYTGRNYYCPCCKASLRRFVEGGEICPACGSGRRQRLQWLHLEQVHNFFHQNYPVLDIAPLPSFQRYCLSSTGLKYQSIDVALPWTTIRADIRAAPYGDETFQVILCSHVLEHIPEDRVAMREIHRLLASGGFALIQVPIDGAETREDASISDPEERRRLYGQADHVRSYGMDVSVRLSQAGLRVEVVPYARQFSKAEQARYGLDPEEVLFVCHKD